LQQSQNFVVKASNFKRDIIAEKKRSSIGKFPNSNTQMGAEAQFQYNTSANSSQFKYNTFNRINQISRINQREKDFLVSSISSKTWLQLKQPRI
jgi:hypothetical protein